MMLKTKSVPSVLARGVFTLVLALATPALAQEASADAAATSGESAPASDSAKETDSPSEDASVEQDSESAGDESAKEETAPTEEGEASEEPAQREEDAAAEGTPTEPEPAEQEPTEPPPPQYEEEGAVAAAASVSAADEVETPELPPAKPPSPFDKGRITLGLGVGMASSYNEDWLILGLGVGYFAIKGLEAHVDSTFWLIGDPFMATLTPGVRYVLHFVPKVKPYVGAFYRHYFVSGDLDDTNAIGARMGLNIMTGKMSYFGAGAVYEHFLDDNLFSDQDQWYPEVTFAFSF